MTDTGINWAEFDWGSVPDWFAAVGTVGAFAATLVILSLDRRRARRAPADELVLWATRRHQMSASSEKRWVTVHAYNTSSGPVPVANVISNVSGNDNINEVLSADGRGFKEIAPGTKVEVEIEIVRYVDDSNLFVFFVDHRGGRWAKRVSDGRLYSPRKGRKAAGIRE